MVKKKIAISAAVLIEHFDAKFNLLIDGYAALDKKIDDFRAEVEKKFRDIDERFKEVDSRFEAINDKFEIVFEELRDLHREKVIRNV